MPATRWEQPAVRGWLALLAVYVFWGSTYGAIRIAVQHYPALLMAGVRFLLPGLALYAFTWRKAGPRTHPVHWRSAFIIGLLLMGGGNGGVTLGEQTLPSSIASLLISTVPFWMVLLDAIRERQLVRPLVVIGLIIGFVGTALLVRPSPSQAIDLRGAATVLIAGALWAAGSIYSRGAPQAQPPLRAIAMDMLAGGALLVLAGTLTGELTHVGWSTEGSLAVLWLSTVGSIIGFSAYLFALRLLPAATVSTYAFVNPVIAVLIGWGVLHEQITGQTLLAMPVIVLGVVLILVARARWSAPKPTKSASDYA